MQTVLIAIASIVGAALLAHLAVVARVLIRAPRNLAEHGVIVLPNADATTRDEWKVTGYPGDPYPPYSFTWPRPGHPDEDAEAEARRFVEQVTNPKYPAWVSGPHLHRRTVVTTLWEPVEAQPGAKPSAQPASAPDKSPIADGAQ